MLLSRRTVRRSVCKQIMSMSYAAQHAWLHGVRAPLVESLLQLADGLDSRADELRRLAETIRREVGRRASRRRGSLRGGAADEAIGSPMASSGPRRSCALRHPIASSAAPPRNDPRAAPSRHPPLPPIFPTPHPWLVRVPGSSSV